MTDTILTTLIRDLDAPRDLVWKCWTESKRFARWFGPRGFELPVCELDPREGGGIRFCHAGPDGFRVWVHGTFREVNPKDRLVFSGMFTDEAGTPTPHPMIPDWPKDAVLITTVTLEALDGNRTRQTVRQEVTPAIHASHPAVINERKLAAEGWAETLDRLEELLAEDPAGL
jgi:uncharacterized protein YndB with AHSA1/START domain